MSTLTPLGDMVNGTVSSVIMMGVAGPINAVKNYKMNHQPIPWGVSLFKGLGTMCIGIVPTIAVQFFAVNVLTAKESTPSLGNTLLAGAIAAPFSTAAEHVSQLQQLYKGGMIENALKVTRSLGVLRLFRGNVPVTLRGAPFTAALFYFPEVLTPHVIKIIPSLAIAKTVSFVGCGVVSGALTTPFDLIRFRMQTGKPQYNTLCNTVVAVTKDEGMQAFMRGWGARASYAGVALTILGWAKEEVPKFFPAEFYV